MKKVCLWKEWAALEKRAEAAGGEFESVVNALWDAICEADLDGCPYSQALEAGDDEEFLREYECEGEGRDPEHQEECWAWWYVADQSE